VDRIALKKKVKTLSSVGAADTGQKSGDSLCIPHDEEQEINRRDRRPDVEMAEVIGKCRS
jgi:hypothetical protein